MNKTIATSALLILLAACSASNEEATSEKNSPKVLTDAVNQPLDKAKEVEQQILDNAAEQRKQVDDL